MSTRCATVALFAVALMPNVAFGQSSVPLFDDPAAWLIEGEKSNDVVFANNEVTIATFGEAPVGRVSRSIDVLPGQVLTLDIAYSGGGALCAEMGCPDAGGKFEAPGLSLLWSAPREMNEIGDYELGHAGDTFTHEYVFTEVGTHLLSFEISSYGVIADMSVSGELITVPEPSSAIVAVVGCIAFYVFHKGSPRS